MRAVVLLSLLAGAAAYARIGQPRLGLTRVVAAMSAFIAASAAACETRSQ